mmetsp:Transcript_54389/g.145246  ORF Transcript_54389/g.145246 Transcript_54389/m.145246 type:complete len:208 (-) Transcript_54389:53-676(-)
MLSRSLPSRVDEGAAVDGASTEPLLDTSIAASPLDNDALLSLRNDCTEAEPSVTLALPLLETWDRRLPDEEGTAVNEDPEEPVLEVGIEGGTPPLLNGILSLLNDCTEEDPPVPLTKSRLEAWASRLPCQVCWPEACGTGASSSASSAIGANAPSGTWIFGNTSRAIFGNTSRRILHLSQLIGFPVKSKLQGLVALASSHAKVKAPL